MIRHDLNACLSVPVELLVREADGGFVEVIYNLPSSLILNDQNNSNGELREAVVFLDGKLADLAKTITGVWKEIQRRWIARPSLMPRLMGWINWRGYRSTRTNPFKHTAITSSQCDDTEHCNRSNPWHPEPLCPCWSRQPSFQCSFPMQTHHILFQFQTPCNHQMEWTCKSQHNPRTNQTRLTSAQSCTYSPK